MLASDDAFLFNHKATRLGRARKDTAGSRAMIERNGMLGGHQYCILPLGAENFEPSCTLLSMATGSLTVLIIAERAHLGICEARPYFI